MKAVAYRRSLPIEDAESLHDVTLPDPTPGPRDLLVRVRAVSVNPVDTKVRRNGAPPEARQGARLGRCRHRRGGRRGCHPVQARRPRLVRRRPDAPGQQRRAAAGRRAHRRPDAGDLDFAEAAALPLTAITAWELLFDRLGVAEATEGRLLVVGAAGGVGSILVQLARRLTRLTVIGTASRDETSAWVTDLGAHHVVDHRRPLAEALREAGIESVSHVASLTQTDQHYAQLVEALAPQGRIALIDDPQQLIDFRLLKRKSASLHWEFMFTRSMFATLDMAQQHALLARVSALVDEGRLRSTLGANFGRIDAVNLKRAHAHLESGTARGKVVLEGY